MKADIFIEDPTNFLKNNPTQKELQEWLDTYAVSKVDLVGVITYLLDCERFKKL
jgi:hypothetical protein